MRTWHSILWQEPRRVLDAGIILLPCSMKYKVGVACCKLLIAVMFEVEFVVACPVSRKRNVCPLVNLPLVCRS